MQSRFSHPWGLASPGVLPSSPLCSSHPQMAQRKIRDILAQVKQQHQKGQSGQTQARRK